MSRYVEPVETQFPEVVFTKMAAKEYVIPSCFVLLVKIIAVDKGFYIPGGTQLYGKFLTLKSCMKACALAPSCFSADYNPWLRKCYQHSNYTACNTRKSHSQFVHFSKVPCSEYSLSSSSLMLELHPFDLLRFRRSTACCITNSQQIDHRVVGRCHLEGGHSSSQKFTALER